MIGLKTWLGEQGLTVRDFALEFKVPLKTAQDWMYRGVAPSPENRDRLTDYIFSRCAHYWIIAAPDGPISDGVCQRSGHQKQFHNSLPDKPWRVSSNVA